MGREVNLPTFPHYSIESLRDQDRSSFFCGVPELDHYLCRQARQDARRKVAAPFVIADRDGHIVGYYTLSSYGIRSAELPPNIAKKLPKYPLIPATLLGRLAVSQAHQGQQLGRLLLLDALYRSWKNTAEVASVGVVAEAYDEKAREFYLRHEFIPLAEHPKKLFIAMGTIEKAFTA
jgi:GNAT superfamily N-acetyltransferase